VSSLLRERFPDLDLGFTPLGTGPTPVRRLPDSLVGGAEVWLKDESGYGDGGWGGNKVRKLEWILPEAVRRGTRTIFTVGGIGTHWGLACALYAREQGLRTTLGLIDQPVDDHVREQQERLRASGAELRYLHTPTRLRLAAPVLLAGLALRDRRRPMFLGPGGSSPLGALGYVEVALEIAAQVQAGDLPEPAVVVSAAGSGGTAAGLALGLRLAGLRTRVLGIDVNDSVRLDDVAIARLANRSAALLRERGADLDVDDLRPTDLTMRDDWLGTTYGDPTPASTSAVAAAADDGLALEPVYTGKALAAVRDLAGTPALPEPVLWLNTHGPRDR
jgi:D-cysteine desulfhydrase